MPLTFTQVLPAFYNTKSDDWVAFDLTDLARTLITNEVWNRKFLYGNTARCSFDATELVACELAVSPKNGWKPPQMDLAEIINSDFLPLSDVPKAQQDFMGRWRHNYVVTKLSIKTDLTVDEDNPEFLDEFQQCHGFMTEIGALFKAAVQLHDSTAFVPPFGRNSSDRGLTLAENETDATWLNVVTDMHTYPGMVCLERQASLANLMSDLAGVWHFDLWPIHRFLKAIPHGDADMDGLLDLLFALEGVFDRNASTDFIKISSALSLLRSGSPNTGLVSDILTRAYRIRNEVVHGAKSTPPAYDSVKIDGKDESTFDLILKLRQVVAGVINQSLAKLYADKSGLKRLRLRLDEVIRRGLNGKWDWE